MRSWEGLALQDTSASRDLLGRRSALVVGSAARDVTSDDPRGWRLGGAVAYSALALARLGLRVHAVIGVDADAAVAPELDLLRAAGAELALAPLARGPVFRNDERSGLRIQTSFQAGDLLPASSLPEGWDAVDALVLAPVGDELEASWVEVAGPATLVALGWQGLLREVADDGVVRPRRPAASALVARAGLVGLSRDDVERALPVAALERPLAPEASLLVTDGVRGGFLAEPVGSARGRRWRSYRAIPADSTVDSTGAGDVFLATLVAARVAGPRLAGPPGSGLDLRLAAAAASLSVEAPGLLGVPDLASVVRRAARARSS